MRESIVESYLKRRVRSEGGEVRKAQWIAHNGAPDRLVLLAGRHVWVELKAPGVIPEHHQLREHERLKRYGFDVRVVDSLDGVDNLIKELTC